MSSKWRNGSSYIQLKLDRIYRIGWIFRFCQFPEETEKKPIAFGEKKIDWIRDSGSVIASTVRRIKLFYLLQANEKNNKKILKIL